MTLLRLLVVPLLLALSWLSPTAWSCESARADCAAASNWDLRLGLGLGLRTNPLADGEQIPLFFLPQWSYSNDYVFIDNLDLGVFVWQGAEQQLNLLATPSYDQIFFDRWNPANVFSYSAGFVSDPGATASDSSFESGAHQAQHDRRLTWLGGVEYSGAGSWLSWQIQWLQDLSDRHGGQELRLALSHDWVRGRQQLSALIGAQWQSSATLDYYYGVTQAEVLSGAGYRPASGVSTLARLDWSYRLSRDWDLRMLLSYRRLSDQISASPLVDKTGVTTLFVGGVYHF